MLTVCRNKKNSSLLEESLNNDSTLTYHDDDSMSDVPDEFDLGEQLGDDDMNDITFSPRKKSKRFEKVVDLCLSTLTK